MFIYKYSIFVIQAWYFFSMKISVLSANIGRYYHWLPLKKKKKIKKDFLIFYIKNIFIIWSKQSFNYYYILRELKEYPRKISKWKKKAKMLTLRMIY